MNSTPFFHPSGVQGKSLSDFAVYYTFSGTYPFTLVSLSGVTLEDLNATMGGGWYRLNGLLDPAYAAAELLVTTVEAPDTLLLRQEWPAAPDMAILTGLEALFSPLPGNLPVSLILSDSVTALPISGADVSIWNSDASEVIIPKLTTSVAGKVVCSLPVGTYTVFLFKPFATFTNLPRGFIVSGSSPLTFTFTGQDAVPPVLPSFPAVTIFGYVVFPNGVVAQGVEVKMRLKNIPQMIGAAGFSKAFVSVFTDAGGYFEINCAGGLFISLECETTGYSRQGQLPASGSINWKAFAVATS